MSEGGLIALEAGLLLLSAAFSGSETALFSLEEHEVQGPGHARVRRLLENRRRLLVTILLGNLFVNILYINLAVLLQERLGGIWIGLVPVLVLVGLILLGEIVPKTLAFRHRHRLAAAVALPLDVLASALTPIRVVLSGVATVVARLVMGARPPEGGLTPEEVDRLVDLFQADGALRHQEAGWLKALLDLGKIPVKQVLVPRVAVVSFELPGTREAFMELLARHRRNKIPVHRGGLDHVEGYLDAKEVLARPEEPLEALVRPLAFVPETALASEVLERLLRDPARMLIVVDEYGGTEGLVTREKMIEAVLGDFADDEEDAPPPYLRLGEDHYEVDASMGVAEAERLCGTLAAPGNVHTVGGLVASELGRVAREGDTVRSGEVSLEVVSMNGVRIERLRLRREGVPGEEGS